MGIAFLVVVLWGAATFDASAGGLVEGARWRNASSSRTSRHSPSLAGSSNIDVQGADAPRRSRKMVLIDEAQGRNGARLASRKEGTSSFSRSS